MWLIYFTTVWLFFSRIPRHTDASILLRHKEFCCWGNQALAFAAIHKQPFPLLHYFGVTDPLSVVSAVQKIMSQGVIFHHSNVSLHSAYQAPGLLQLFLWDLLDHLDDCLCHWRNTWEVGDFTVTRKWKWLFMNGCKCKCPTMMES